MRTFCPTCNTALQFDEKKVSTATINLRCFKCTHVFEVNVALLKEQQAASHIEEKTMIEQPLAKENTQEVGWIIVHDEHTQTQTYSLKLGKNTIGRKSETVKADIAIQTEDKIMSRNHCTIEVSPNRMGTYNYILSDNNSKNGIYINADKGKKINAHTQIFLEDGNTIQIGITKVVLKTPNFAANKDLAQKQVAELDYNRTIID